MSILSENMRYLRAQQKYAQQKIADDLLITRGRYAKYEDGATEPPIEILVRISKYYRVSIDLLVGIDLRKYTLEKMMQLPDNRTILPITVDERGENKIEIIPAKAQMGYLQGYSDPEYIEKLQTISLPFLRNGKFRAFPASGDSMPPFKDGTFIVGKYVENVSDLKIGKTYIFITPVYWYSMSGILKVFFENTTFCEISPAGLRESHVHDVVITKEAPNYRIEN